MASQLNSVVRSVFEGVCAELPWRDEFGCFPLLDAELGDLSSSAALEVAKHRRVSVSEIGETFLLAIRAQLPGEWRIENGFLIVSRLPREALANEASAWRAGWEGRSPSGAGTREQIVIAVADDPRLPIYIRMRLAGIAALQGWFAALSGRSCAFSIGEQEPLSGIDAHRRWELLQRYSSWLGAQVRPAPEPGATPMIELRRLRDSQPGTHFLWISRSTYERLPKHDRAELQRARCEGRYQVRIPEDGWLVSRDRTLAEVLAQPSLEKISARLSSEDTKLRWLFHVASTTPSSDFDPYVALGDECSSLVWNVRALGQRFHQVVGETPPVRREEGALEGVPGMCAASVEWMERERFPWRRLAMHGEWCEYWIERAVAQGEMESLLTVLEQFGWWGHRVLNAPQTRMWLSNPQEGTVYSEIIASLRRGLAVILPAVSVE